MTVMAGPRVIVFGSEGGFSRPVLAELLARAVPVVTVVQPGVAVHKWPVTGSQLPVEQAANPATLAGLARTHQIPVRYTPDLRDPALAVELARFKPDLSLVACFPRKLPARLVALPRIGCWNLHPSLLPKYRGPAPLFWQLHHREQHTGITLHEVTQAMDAGDIIAQAALPLPADLGAASLDNWVATHGVALVLDALTAWRAGRLVSRPQDDAVASCFPYPGA
jgi:methionyl-tRNA formyltransferase